MSPARLAPLARSRSMTTPPMAPAPITPMRLPCNADMDVSISLGADGLGDDAPRRVSVDESLGVGAEHLVLGRTIHVQDLAQDAPALLEPRAEPGRLPPVGVAAVDDAVGSERVQELPDELGPH